MCKALIAVSSTWKGGDFNKGKSPRMGYGVVLLSMAVWIFASLGVYFWFCVFFSVCQGFCYCWIWFCLCVVLCTCLSKWVMHGAFMKVKGPPLVWVLTFFYPVWNRVSLFTVVCTRLAGPQAPGDFVPVSCLSVEAQRLQVYGMLPCLALLGSWDSNSGSHVCATRV